MLLCARQLTLLPGDAAAVAPAGYGRCAFAAEAQRGQAGVAIEVKLVRAN